jgi:hypothetical protein
MTNEEYAHILLSAVRAMKDIAKMESVSVRDVVAVARLVELQGDGVIEAESDGYVYGNMSSPEYVYSVG